MLLKGCQENPQDSNYGRLYGGNGRRLRHLLPRPSTSVKKNFAPACCSMFSMNHQQASAADHHVHSRKEEKHVEMEHIVSSRWNPTPEQLMALEEMYRRGVRTPSSEEIKLIAAKLRQFGKIEGKNVFYWFQNHKARERQKRRRQLEPSASKNLGNDQETPEENDKGFGKKDLEAQENSRLITSLKDPHASVQGPMVAEEEQMQLLKIQRKMAKNSPVDLLSSKASDIVIKAKDSSENQQQQKMMLSTVDFSLFSSSSVNYNAMINKEDESSATRQHQTLELFPLQKDERVFKEQHRVSMNTSSNHTVPPNQFYEFL